MQPWEMRTMDSTLIARTARKRWRCYAFDAPSETPSPDCVRDIEVGTRYVEYVGEAGFAQSGHHYCAPCAVQIWHVEVTARCACGAGEDAGCPCTST